MPLPAAPPAPPVAVGTRCAGPGKAFTLVEMLVVMLVIVLLITATAPLIRGIFTARNVGDGLDLISGYLAYARTQAVTQNTYVLVGFYQQRGSDDLQIGSVVSVNGTFDPAAFAASPAASPASTPAYNPSYPALGNVIHVPNVTLVSEPNLTSGLIDKLKTAKVESGISDGSIVDCVSTPSIFSFVSGRATFGSAVASTGSFPSSIFLYSPQGEALYFSSKAFPNYPGTPINLTPALPFYSQLFLGVRATRGGSVVQNDNNSAALTVDGGSGDIKTFRQ